MKADYSDLAMTDDDYSHPSKIILLITNLYHSNLSSLREFINHYRTTENYLQLKQKPGKNYYETICYALTTDNINNVDIDELRDALETTKTNAKNTIDKKMADSLKTVTTLLAPVLQLRENWFRVSCVAGVNFAGASPSGNIKTIFNGDNLSYADLSGMDQRDCWFNRANLSYANLSKANLPGACLTDANLLGADLSDANFSGASLSGCNLLECNLTGTSFENAIMFEQMKLGSFNLQAFQKDLQELSKKCVSDLNYVRELKELSKRHPIQCEIAAKQIASWALKQACKTDFTENKLTELSLLFETVSTYFEEASNKLILKNTMLEIESKMENKFKEEISRGFSFWFAATKTSDTDESRHSESKKSKKSPMIPLTLTDWNVVEKVLKKFNLKEDAVDISYGERSDKSEFTIMLTLDQFDDYSQTKEEQNNSL